MRLVRAPVEFVPKLIVGSGLGGLFRHPHGDNIVVELVIGGQLDQGHRALAPVPLRLHPQTGPAFVAHAVEVMVEGSIALQQAEAARCFIGE